MKHEDDIVKVFIGVEATALLLQGILGEAGITSLIKNDSSSAFLGVLPQDMDLYIQKSDLNEAEAIIKDFLKKAEA